MPSSSTNAGKDDSSKGDEFEVQEIRDKRPFNGGKMYYRVHWQGYGTEDDSWEPEESVACSCSALVGAFERKQQRQADNETYVSSSSSSSFLSTGSSEAEDVLSAKRRKQQVRAPPTATATKGRKRKASVSQKAKPKRDASKKVAKKRPFKCEYDGCDAALPSLSALTVHVRTHTGEKPFKCDVDECGVAIY